MPEAFSIGRLLDRFWDRVTDGLPGSDAVDRLRAAGVEPADPRAAAAVSPMAGGLAEFLGRRDSPAFRCWLVAQLDAHTDPRAERYWQLVGILLGRPDEEFTARTADHAWLLAALRHHQDRPGVPP